MRVQRQGATFQTTAIRNAILPEALLSKQSPQLSARLFGTRVIDLGTPYINTSWDIQFFSIIPGSVALYEKAFGSIVAEAAFTLAVVLEVLVAGSPVSSQYSNTITLPIGARGPKTNREAGLTGGANLPQSFSVPGGQQVTARLFRQILAAEGPEEPATYESLSAVKAPATPLEIIMGYTQNG